MRENCTYGLMRGGLGNQSSTLQKPFRNRINMQNPVYQKAAIFCTFKLWNTPVDNRKNRTPQGVRLFMGYWQVGVSCISVD
jgi:hypothetical protein